MFAIRVTGPSGYSRYIADLDCESLSGVDSDAALFDDKETAEDAEEQFGPYWRQRGYVVDVCDLDADGG